MYNNILVVGDSFGVTAWGFLFPNGQQDISSVYIGFQGASYSDKGINAIEPLFKIGLYNADTYMRPLSVPSTINSTNGMIIEWGAEGDYYPFLDIHFTNQSIRYPLNVGKVHVSGVDVVQQQEAALAQADRDRRNMWVGVDIVLIPVMSTLIAYILKLKERWST